MPLPDSARRGRRSLPLVLLALVALLIPAGVVAVKPPVEPIRIQLVNVSDWHGQLDPNSVFGVGNVGGAAVLSAYFAAERLANPNTLTLTAGDDIGATPALSNFFDDVPAILAERMMGIQVGTLGNHNFDAGLGRLQDQIDLAASTTDLGSPFSYVSANLSNLDDNLDGVEPYRIFDVGGVKVAVIGVTNPEAPGLVFPGSFGTMEPTDPVKAALKARNAAKDAGAEVIVVITHMGVTGFDGNGAPVGPLVDFAKAVNAKSQKVDVILGDHTDVLWSGTINGALVLENRSKGLTYARTSLAIDPNTRKVVGSSVAFVTPFAAAVTPDPAIVAMLAPYRTSLAAIFDTPIAEATGIFVRGGNIERRQEVAIGNLIADGMRLRYGTQIAFMNGGSIRASLPSSYLPLNLSLRRTAAPYVIGPNYDIVVGDVYTVLPFGNDLVTRTVTGAQLWLMLENGVSRINPDCTGTDGRFPQISGFKFTFKCTNAVGSRVLSVALMDDTPIPADGTTYTMTTTNFLNAGGDAYTMLADGQGVSRDLDAQVLLDYLIDLGTITPTTDGRITKLP